ncbi:acyltransferase family protein, partial [Asanoa sp. NPDC050611]|uniref:acyltransferase family protein n=1 Tax=Asanoa sp. NPDC050611 TaxID=3157098 RepID=UPI0033DA922F
VALATAAVIAHAVVSPRSPTARVLGLLPLVLIGRISYGLYLWHWPIFGWLTADRTGVTGLPLLGLRLVTVFAVATASYLLVERPIRTARWTRRRPRLSATAGVSAALATALVATLLTVPPPARPVPQIALDTRPGPAASASATPPIQRAGRTPGALPRIAFMGDSVSWSLGTYLPKQDKLQVTARGVPGCGIARLPEIIYVGSPHPNYPGCDKWDQRWQRNIRTDDPDVAVILLDRWELMDRKLNGRYQHVGQPEFDAYLARELNRAIDVVAARGGHVVVLTAPYTRRAERPDGGLWPEDDPARVDAWNRLLTATAAQRRATVLDLRTVVCPDGRFTWDAGGVRIRSDGLHFTPEGVQQVIAPWLLPQLARIARTGA